jgi:MFS family permease
MTGAEGRETGRPAVEEGELGGAYAKRVLVVMALLLGFIVYIDIMLTPSLPKIAAEYRVTIAQASLMISLYTVSGVSVIPIVGKLGDIYGKRRVLVYVLAIYVPVAAVTSFLPDFGAILVSRTVQGVGLGILPLSISLAREQFPRELIPRTQGIITATQVAGGGAGLIAGTLIASVYGWQGNYHIAIPFVAALSILTFMLLKESPNRKPGARLDYLGAAWLGASLAAIILGLSEGASWGWESAPTLGLVVSGLILLVPLAVYEGRVKEPILDLQLLRERNVMLSNIFVLTYGISTYMMYLSVIYILELAPPSGFGLGIVVAGFYLLPLVVVLLPVSYATGALISKYGVKPFFYLGSVFGAAGSFLLSIYSSPESLIPPLVIFSISLGLVAVSSQNLLVLSVRKSEMGIAASMNSVFRYTGTSLGAPIAGAVLSTFVATYSVSGRAVSLPTREAFQYCSYVMVIGFIIIGLLTLFTREVIREQKDKGEG